VQGGRLLAVCGAIGVDQRAIHDHVRMTGDLGCE